MKVVNKKIKLLNIIVYFEGKHFIKIKAHKNTITGNII